MNLQTYTENHYSKLSINCDSPIGEVTFIENYIPNSAVEQFAEKVLKGFSDHYNIENCITEITKQIFGEDKIQPTTNFKLNARTQALKDNLHKSANPWIHNKHPHRFYFGMIAFAICAGTLAYQSLQTIIHLQKKQPKQALKHGLVAIISFVTLIIFQNVLRM